MNKSLALLNFALAAAFAAPAQAAPLQGPAYIAASTSVPTCGAFCDNWGADIGQVADGDTSNFNGFAGQTGVLGTIKLDLLGDFKLTSFSLWNDLNVLNEGVRSFALDFFDAADALIGSTGTLAAVSPSDASAPPAVYAFAAVSNVSRVDMRVLEVSGRIEIREVAFNGTPTGPGGTVPEPAGLALVAAGLLAAAAVRRRPR